MTVIRKVIKVMVENDNNINFRNTNYKNYN